MDQAWFLAQIVFALRESDWTQVLDFFWLDDNKIPTNICWIFWGSRVWGKLGWIFRETVSRCTQIWLWWAQKIPALFSMKRRKYISNLFDRLVGQGRLQRSWRCPVEGETIVRRRADRALRACQRKEQGSPTCSATVSASLPGVKLICFRDYNSPIMNA